MSDYTEILQQFSGDRSYLISSSQAAQEQDGYVSDEAIMAISRHFAVSQVEVEGVVSFYSQFKRVKPGKYILSVCDGTACHIKGSSLVMGWISDELGISAGETTADGLFTLDVVACLGCCSLAPVVAVNGAVHGNLDRKSLLKTLEKYKKEGESNDQKN